MTLDNNIEQSIRIAKIAKLNDTLRETGHGGQIVHTSTIVELFAGKPESLIVKKKVREAIFSKDNDPHGERDFGTFTVDGLKCFWKIDYYDNDLKFHSPDPTDPDVTRRIMTIGAMSDY